MLVDLTSVPQVLIGKWLKDVKGLSASSDPKAQVRKHLLDEKLTEEEIRDFINECGQYGRKHFFLFSLPEQKWDELSLNALRERVSQLEAGVRGITGVGDLAIINNEVSGHKYFLGMNEYVKIPEVNKNEVINYNGREWAALVYKDIPIHLYITVDLSEKKIELKFDSVFGMKYQETRTNAAEFLTNTLGLEQLTTVPLSPLASAIENSSYGVTSDLIVKVETDDGITGTIRLSRDENDEASVTELPGGSESLDETNLDMLQETFDIIWLADHSGGEISRNIKSRIRTSIGDVHFQQYVLKNEAEYVLSKVKKIV